jgi:glucosamine--fructose-6-phosphate aminotransferase (isomerizing)
MCGIIGATASRNIVPILIEGLHRLEYRGYDSAGVAVVGDQGILGEKTVGQVAVLESAVEKSGLVGHCGVGHTRWATHGKPSSTNAHPHHSNEILAVVHNGIIENHQALKNDLCAKGYEFVSQTDTEVIAHLIHYHLQKNPAISDRRAVILQAVSELEGAYAIAVIFADLPDHIFGARMGSPLVLGVSTEESYLASDPLALLQVTDRMCYLENGDVVVLTPKHGQIIDLQGREIERPIERFLHGDQAVDKGSYRHFMLKEIFEQPTAIANSLADKVGKERLLTEALGAEGFEQLRDIDQLHIVACGTSYHAGMVAKYWLESIAGVAVNVEVASEYRYRAPMVPANTAFLCISQSGETADTLAALRYAKEQSYLTTLGICNMAGATLVREADLRLLTHAGIEVGVASTKAFTTQLSVLYWLTLVMAKARGRLNAELEREAVHQLHGLPHWVEAAAAQHAAIEQLAFDLVDKAHCLFLGRGVHYPVALEGALKLKEISYIHAEAYPAGELKHGPLALVDENMPVITVAPDDHLLEKLKSNLQEVAARGGELINVVSTRVSLDETDAKHSLRIEGMEGPLSPIVASVPLQLLAYYVALHKGTDVDRPRNLAKSVTVE